MFGKKPPPNTDPLSARVRMIAERRPSVAPAAKARAERRAVFRNATILLDSGERFAVAVKDVGEGGARIEFFSDVPLAGAFTFIEPTLKLRRRARLAWRKEGAAGLTFTD